jgi:hypothetical protein
VLAHSAGGGRTPASVRLRRARLAARRRRRWPAASQAVRHSRRDEGRERETPVDRTQKHRHDLRGGEPALHFSGGKSGAYVRQDKRCSAGDVTGLETLTQSGRLSIGAAPDVVLMRWRRTSIRPWLLRKRPANAALLCPGSTCRGYCWKVGSSRRRTSPAPVCAS